MLILPVKGKGLTRSRCILEISVWLSQWHCQQGFSFFDCGMVFQEDGMLARDGVHLTEGVSRLADLVRRALTLVHWGIEAKAQR